MLNIPEYYLQVPFINEHRHKLQKLHESYQRTLDNIFSNYMGAKHDADRLLKATDISNAVAKYCSDDCCSYGHSSSDSHCKDCACRNYLDREVIEV